MFSHSFLVFLTGQEEIEQACAEIRTALKGSDHKFNVIPFYAALGHNRTDIFDLAEGERKIVVATNIAETSITIPDIRVVIDSGKVKQK